MKPPFICAIPCLSLALTFALSLGCEEYSGPKAKAGVDPLGERAVQWPTQPRPRPTIPEGTPRGKAPTPTPAPKPGEDPALSGQKAALADVGRAAFDALRNDQFDELLALTTQGDGPLTELCPDRDVDVTPKELEARFDFCRRTIAWDAVADAKVMASRPTGDPAQGCDAGIEDYGRLQLYLTMEDETIYRVEFYGAVGLDGKIVGLDGALTCNETDAVPAAR